MTLPGPVFVTGASGYLGLRVVQRLRADGLPVQAIVRSQTAQRSLEVLGVDPIQLGSPELFAPMRQAIHGAKTALHLAGAQRQLRGSRFEHANTGTGSMFARVAKEEGIAKAVIVSCLGDPENSRRLRSQRSAEEALRVAGVPYTILRLAPVCGPGGRVDAWLESLARGEGVPIRGDGRARWRPLHVEDAIDAIAAVLDPEIAVGETIEVGGGESLTLRELAARFGAASRFEGRGLPLPEAVRRRLRRRDLLAPMPPADLLLDMDPGTAGAERLGIAPRPIGAPAERSAAPTATGRS